MSWPMYDDEQIEQVVSVLRSGKVNAWTGPHVGDFEKAYAKFVGREHAIALANGSVALDVALKAMNLKPGDEVVVTPRSFVASASCVPLAGGTPVFADVDLVSQNLTAETIEAAITEQTRAVIVVHVAGWPCEMEEIMDLAKRRNIIVIEDCAQAHGAELNGRPIGSYGHMACFSFCQDKIITTGGEGGMLLMDDMALWVNAWSFKDHGKSRDRVYENAPPGFRWLHESFGTNLRMSSVQAVIGMNQLEKLPDWNLTRGNNAATMEAEFADASALRTPMPKQHHKHAWYRFYTFVRPDTLKSDWSRDRIVEETGKLGVPCFSGSCSEIYREKAFVHARLGPKERLPNARELGETSLAYLVSPDLDTEMVARHATTAREVIEEATAG